MNQIILILYFISFIHNFKAQLTNNKTVPLQKEWQKELDIPGSGLEAMNGLILDARQNLCVIANQSGTKVFGFDNKTEPTEIYSIPSLFMVGGVKQ